MSDLTREALVAEAERVLPVVNHVAILAKQVNLAGTTGDDALRDISTLVNHLLSLLHADAAKVQELEGCIRDLEAVVQSMRFPC